MLKLLSYGKKYLHTCTSILPLNRHNCTKTGVYVSVFNVSLVRSEIQ